MVAGSSLVQALLVAPAGAVTLAALEAGALRVGDLESIDGIERGEPDSETEIAAVRDVVAAGFDDLVEVAVFAAIQLAGPHSGDSAANVARALRAGPGRRRLAEAIVDRFGGRLEAIMDRQRQEWWWVYDIDDWVDVMPLGSHPGEHWAWFTAPRNWFCTINPAPPLLRGVFGLAWDESSDDLTRWTVAIDPAARIFEIHRPEDWVALVVEHPDDSRTGNYEGWELNPSERNRELGWDELGDVPNQRAGRTEVRRFLEPDWASVATEWDAVHLSWAGFLTTEGTVSDLGDGAVTMLRGWGSERTLWLNPVLSVPQPIHPDPLDQPSRRRHDAGNRTVDLRNDHLRYERQLAFLNHRLNLSYP